MNFTYLPRTFFFFFFNDTATTEIYTLSLHAALPIALDLSEGRPAEAPGLASSSVEVSELRVGPAVRAGGYAVGERPESRFAADGLAAFARVPAAAGVDVDGWRVPVEAHFEEPVGLGRPVFFAPLPFGFPLLGFRDGLPHLGEGEGEPRLECAEAGQVGWQVLHAASLQDL